MLFDFAAFIDELREKSEKKQIVEKYEKQFGPISGDIKDQARYKDYVSGFKSIEYKVPSELEKDFDWSLLQQLVLASFSSDYEFKKSEKKDDFMDLYIAVKSGDQSVVKTVSELRSFQVLRLYEIYIEEQMNLHALQQEDEKEKNAITQEREMRKKKWKAVLETLDREELHKEAKAEQESKLNDLMGKL